MGGGGGGGQFLLIFVYVYFGFFLPNIHKNTRGFYFQFIRRVYNINLYL